jgi:ABC-type transporter Mla maintaining outer membrane lipid asymmetry ATPase subunit MlaF
VLIDGRFAAAGTPHELRESTDPAVIAFFAGEAR